MQVDKISDQETLEAWLEGLPQVTEHQREDAARWAGAIAHRAAMRVLPSFWLSGASDTGRSLAEDTLVGLRCALTTSVATVFLTAEIEAAVNDAGSRATAIYDNMGTSGQASLQATLASLSAVVSKTFANTKRAFSTACYMNFAIGVEIEIQTDVNACSSGSDVFLCPLWQSEMPKGVNILKQWYQVRDKLLSQPSEWGFWIDWYENTLLGRPQDWKLLTKVALINSEDWDKGAAHVNRLIKQIIEGRNFSSSPKPQSSATIQAVKVAVAKSGPILTLQLAALEDVVAQEIERVRSTNTLEPEIRDRLLGALTGLQKATQEIVKLLPVSGSLTDVAAIEFISWAEVIKTECLHWNSEAKKFAAGKSADKRVVLAGSIVLASAVTATLTFAGLASLGTLAGGAILLKGKLQDIPKAISALRSGNSPQ